MSIGKFYIPCLILLALTACSKSPKEQALAGFTNSCNVANLPEVKKYCDCMVKELDAAIPNQVFNDPNADPGRLANAFAATAFQLAPKCKKE